MASVIKRAACEALIEAIVEAIPALDGAVHIAPETPNHPLGDPCLVIIPRSFRFEPFQEDPLQETFDVGETEGQLVSSVGEIHGTIEMQLVTLTDPMREDLEDRLNHLFWSREGSPGIIVRDLEGVQVNGVELSYRPSAAYAHSGENWQDEFAFSNQRWRMQDVSVSFPALVVRNVTKIENLYLGITSDLESDVAEESVEVLEDGSIEEE